MTTPNSNIPPQGAGRKSQQGATERDDARLTFLVERAFLDGAPSPDVETAFRTCRRQVEGTEVAAGGDEDTEATPSRWTVVWKVVAALAASLLLFITFAPKGLLHSDSSSAPAVVLRKMPTIDDAHQRGGVSIAAGSMTLTTTTAQAHGITVLPDNIIKVEHTTQQEAETYTLRVAEGKTAQLLLPDGTHVWLSVASATTSAREPRAVWRYVVKPFSMFIMMPQHPSPLMPATVALLSTAHASTFATLRVTHHR